MRSYSIPCRRNRPRKGQALVEFALVALALYLLFAAVLELGRCLFIAQVVQQAADVGARELSLTPAGALRTFDEVMYALDPSLPGNEDVASVRNAIFDEQWLVIDTAEIPTGTTLVDFFADKPVINRLLIPVMIYDRVIVDGVERQLFRYPGALVNRTSDDELTVRIPVVTGRDASGVETIEWRPVVEEIADPDAVGEPSSFSFASRFRGLVALRINYPFQAAALTGNLSNPAGPLEPTIGPIEAHDESVSPTGDPEPGLALVVGNESLVPGFGTNSGRYGLGRLYALGVPGGVRPYRKLLSCQGIYRREVLE